MDTDWQTHIKLRLQSTPLQHSAGTHGAGPQLNQFKVLGLD
jgi:hypothetical protein